MTWRRYKRLTLVLLLPLLLAGWLTARGKWSEDDSRFACEEIGTDQFCSHIGWTGSVHDSVMKSQPAWFEIRPTELDTSPAATWFIVSRRFFQGAEVVAARPFSGGGPTAISLMSGLVGKRGSVLLGMLDGERTIILENAVDLACNDLMFATMPGKYEASCFGEGWAGPVIFTLTGSELQRMERLRQAIEAKADDQRIEYRLFQIIMYPRFLYFYLIASGLVWLGIVAVRYVRAG